MQRNIQCQEVACWEQGPVFINMGERRFAVQHWIGFRYSCLTQCCERNNEQKLVKGLNYRKARCGGWEATLGRACDWWHVQSGCAGHLLFGNAVRKPGQLVSWGIPLPSTQAAPGGAEGVNESLWSQQSGWQECWGKAWTHCGYSAET